MRWVLLLLLVILAGLQYRLWVEQGSLGEVTLLRREIATQRAEMDKLRERNRALQAEVQDLKQGLEAIEERARGELGMVKPGEIFLQLLEPEESKRR